MKPAIGRDDERSERFEVIGMASGHPVVPGVEGMYERRLVRVLTDPLPVNFRLSLLAKTAKPMGKQAVPMRPCFDHE